MPDERLRIVVEAVDKATATLKGLQKELEGVGASGKKGGTGIKKATKEIDIMKKVLPLAAGALVAFGLAAKKAFEFAQEGAQITQTVKSFDRLGVSIEDLRAASLGTVDDMTLMASTLTLTAGASEELQGELLGAAPELMKIAKAASALNPTLGTTAHMYESIATGIKRSSPLILDNLGIIVKIGEANEIYAEQLGKAVTQLTAEEKQIALLNATMRAGNRLIEQNGNSVESATDAYARIKVNTKNATDAFKEHVHEGLEPVVKWLDRAIFGYQELKRVQDAVNSGVNQGTDEYTDYVAAQKKAIQATGNNTNLMFEWRDAARQADLAGSGFTEGQVKMMRVSKDVDKMLELTADGYIELSGVMSRADFEMTKLRSGSRGVSEEEKKAADIRLMLSKITGNSAESMAQYTEAIQRADEYMSQELYESMVDLRTVTEDTSGRFEKLSTIFSSTLTPSLEDAKEQIGELRGAESELIGQISELESKSYLTGAQKEDLANLKTELGNVQGAIGDVISDTERMIGMFVLNMTMAAITADGIVTEAESEMVGHVGRQLGLWDEVTANMISRTGEAVDAVNTGLLEPIESANLLVEGVKEVGEEYLGVQEKAIPALADVREATDTNVSRMELLGIEAQTTQNIIGSMVGKNIDIYITTHERTIRHAQSALDFEEQVNPSNPGNNANGTDFWRGGMSWVGERGPELVNLPRGSQVHDAQTSQSIVNNNHDYGGLTINTPQVSNQFEQEWAYLQAISQ